MIDSPEEVAAERARRGIAGDILLDTDRSASMAYDALEASMHPGVKPGHSFILVNTYGLIIWRWDWPGHGSPMYLEVDELYDSVSEWLERSGETAF
jgi:hypothetical protein